MKTKTICGVEFFLLVFSVFAFSYFLSFSSSDFEKAEGLDFSFFRSLWNEIKKPMFKIVSAEGGAGCCSLSNDGIKCLTSTQENCKGDFAEGALCSSTSFCKKGCCYDEISGIFDTNVLRSDCKKEWSEDYNCNLPGAKKGCCVLGGVAIFETAGQCNTDTNVRAIGGKGLVDFRDVNEMECLMLSGTEKEGACVVGNSCKFVTEKECLNYNGKFSEGYLCTSNELGSLCEKTTQTTCAEGKDGVYFLDSCGNRENIYDSSKVNDQNYWEKVVLFENSCDGKSGSSKSATCGNCNRFLGGICSSAGADNFKVISGNFYCTPTSCNYKGEEYKNGESWCVYDGVVGNGSDVVGSRHWRYVCNYGEVQIEPCADYRNQICIQTNTFDVEGQSVEFRNSACVANNWRECVGLNSEEGGMEKCASALNCEVRKIDIADHFNFDACTPKYPGGFNLNDVRYAEMAKQICGMASQKCTVVYKPKMMGGCSVEANGDCLTEAFGQKMNDFCRSLGDCGGEVNIVGQYSENYKITESPKLSPTWITKLKSLANPVPGQFAEVENYTEYLEAAGIMSASVDGEPYDISGDIMKAGMGVGGVGYAAALAVSLYYGTPLTLSTLSLSGLGGLGTPAIASFAGAAIGAGVGMFAGAYIAKQMGLSPMGSILMSVGGAMIGAYIGAYLMNSALLMSILGPFFWVGIVIMIIGAFFGGSDCDPVVVEFICKPWEAPKGGSDCEKCNNDVDKPCSEYRCQSLGAACELINKGSGSEMCVEKNPNDITPPKISPEYGTISERITYEESKNGFGLKSDGGCVDAYTDLVFGVNTDEPAQCKFDVSMTNFSDMQFDMGGNIFSYNHTTGMVLPDPSHGESKGGNWSGDVNLYVKCQDTHGVETQGYYVINMCVNQGADKTAPRIRTTEPQSNALVSFNSTGERAKIITNEFSECKWSSNDGDYLTMENSFVCNDTLANPSSTFGYLCTGTLPIASVENKFYIKCMDQPWLNGSGNSNSDSLTYILRKPEKPISIDEVLPNAGFESSTDYTTINLQATTSGGGSEHVCAYSFSGYNKMIDFFERDVNVHKQPLNVRSAKNHIYIQCRDETGDYARAETEFMITYDDSSPVISRVWRTDNKINFVTSEDSICAYSEDSCVINLNNSTELLTEHSIDVLNGKVYYIKCKDVFGNAPAGCSITVNAAGKIA